MSAVAAPASAPVTVAELVAAVRAQQGEGAIPEVRQVPEASRSTSAVSLLVVPAHPGAGATTVSVALADALGGPDSPVQLVDTAPTECSGMLGATACEMSNGLGPWRRGRRGYVTVDRPTRSMSLAELPPLPLTRSAAVVIDAGAGWRNLSMEPNRLWPPDDNTKVLLVCRATVPGVRHAELALAAFAGAIVVGVGAKRWPRPVSAAFGERLTQARREGRVGLLPSDRRLEVNGIDTHPLPKSVAAAAARLACLIGPDTFAPTTQTLKGRRR